jgi:hypothetical protein
MNIDCCKSYVGKQIIGLLPNDGGTPPPSPCLYVAFVDFGSLQPIDLFFDAALTQPLFTNNIGDGALRSLMQFNGGELYGVFNDFGNFIYSGCHMYYYGTSANNFDVYTLGGYLTSVSFNPMSAFALPCENMICYTTTLDSNFNRLYYIEYVTPVLYEYLDLLVNPPYASFIDLTDEISSALFFRQLYGQNLNYTYVDNGNGTSTITLDKAIDWNNNGSGIYLEIFDGIVSTGFVLNPC